MVKISLMNSLMNLSPWWRLKISALLMAICFQGLDKEEKDKDGKYIRQERYAGSCSRSFYIGNEVDPAAVTAKFENGILQISVPKASRQLPAKSTVEIK